LFGLVVEPGPHQEDRPQSKQDRKAIITVVPVRTSVPLLTPEILRCFARSNGLTLVWNW
jgi:hypothetical protein